MRRPALLCAPLCMFLEVFMDLQQPTLMADIIDVGVAGGDLQYVLRTGGRMIAYALIGLIGGAGCSALTTYASTHMAGELRGRLFAREAMVQGAFDGINRRLVGNSLSRTRSWSSWKAKPAS